MIAFEYGNYFFMGCQRSYVYLAEWCTFTLSERDKHLPSSFQMNSYAYVFLSYGLNVLTLCTAEPVGLRCKW